MRTISRTVSPGQQSVDFSEVLEADGFKLKIAIKSDAYSFQSSATISAFSPTELKWNVIASIHHGSMNTPTGLCYQPNGGGLDLRHFEADRNELVRQAAAILDIDPESSAPGPRR